VVSPVAASSTLIVNGSGQLTGATGVFVNGTSYDVEFVDDRCTVIFSGCDSTSDFDFQNPTDAFAATQALLDQVFIGQFDTDYSLTLGCPGVIGITISCEVLVPFQPPFLVFQAFAAAAFNTNDAVDGTDLVEFEPVDDLSDGGDDRFRVFARFMPSAISVPEPSSWAMMLLGLGMTGTWLRRRRPPGLIQLA
jgi:hypothetical protein